MLMKCVRGRIRWLISCTMVDGYGWKLAWANMRSYQSYTLGACGTQIRRKWGDLTFLFYGQVSLYCDLSIKNLTLDLPNF